MEMTGDQMGEPEREDDSGIESSAPDPTDSTVYIRVSITDLKIQKVLQFHQDDSVWNAKQRVLSTLAKDLKDGLNYGLYCPPMNGRAGKFLDEERPLRDYPLQGPIGFLELKYKRRVYKLMLVNPRKLRQLHTKANLKQFMEAVRTNNQEKMTKMLNKGLDPNFHDHDSGGTPLTMAATLSKPRTVILVLINGGAHIDFRTKSGLTCVHMAAQKGNYEGLKTLLDLGASPNYKDAQGLTPLYHCVCHDTNAHCVEILLHDHSTVGVTDEQGWTEVHQACRRGHVQHLEHLLFYGAEMNTQNSSGNTPLHVCAVNNQESCARVLLFRGVDRTVLNYSNQDAFQVAVISANAELAQIIHNYKDEEVVPFQEVPKYNEKRRGTITSMYTLTRSRSDPRLNVSYADNSKPPSPAMSNSSMPHFANGIFDPSNAGMLYKGNNYDSDSPRSMSISSTGSCSGSFSSDSLPKSLTRARSMETLLRSTSRSSSALDHSPSRPEYSYSRRRLYPALPGRTFICVKIHRPKNEAELGLRKGEFVEVLSVGEQGYWEGKVGHREGWFPSYCVQEVHLRKKGLPKAAIAEESVLVKRGTLAALAQTDRENASAPRTVVLQKGKQGFGFVLRGAKCQRHHGSSLDFSPTPEFPALQYLDRVDKGSMADKAGLKGGDFLLEINGENIVNATHEHTVRVIKSSGDTLAMKVITVKPLSQDGMEVHMDGTRTLPAKKKAAPPKAPVRNPHTSLSTRMNNSNAHTMIESIAELEKLDNALAQYETDPDSQSLNAMAASRGVDPNNKTASIRRTTKRLTSVPLGEIFTQEEDENVDTERSASNQAKPVVGVPGRIYASPAELRARMGQGSLGHSQALSTPNLEDYSQHAARVELRDRDRPRAGAYPHHSPGQYTAGGHTVTNVRISTMESRDHVTYHKEPDDRIYAVPYTKGLPRYGSAELLADQEQSSADSGLSVHIGQQSGRPLPPEPKAPPPPPPHGSGVMIPPPPTHPAPAPPSPEVGEMIAINTRTQNEYANVSVDIMRRKAVQQTPPESDASVESSFRPGAGARFSKQPAMLPKAAVIVKGEHSRSSSMSSTVSSTVSDNSSGRMAAYNVLTSQTSVEAENNVVVAPAATDVYYRRGSDSYGRNERYYEPEPDYEIEGGVSVDGVDVRQKSKVLSTPVPSPSQQKNSRGDNNAFGDSIKAAAIAREKRAREEELRKEEEAQQRKAAEEAKQKLAAEEARHRQIEEDAKKRRAEEESRQRQATEEARRKQVAAAAVAAKQKQAAEEARRKQLEDEVKRKQAAEELKQRQAAAAAAAKQRYAAEEAKQRQAEEELRQRKAEEEEMRRKKAEEEETRRKKAEEEARRQAVLLAAMQKKAEEDARRKDAEVRRKREEETKRKQEEELRRKQEEELQRKQREEAHRKQEEETRKREQEAREKREAEEQARQRKLAEAEQERVRALQAATVAASRPPPPPSNVPPPPPVAPPAPPLELRNTPPASLRQVPPHVKKEMEEKKRKEDSHAALMAAVARRRNMMEQTDGNDTGLSIEERVARTKKMQGTPTKSYGAKTVVTTGKEPNGVAKKPEPVAPVPQTVKVAQTTKVVTTGVTQEKRKAPQPPTSPAPATNAPTLENKPEGGTSDELDFLAMAERRRQEWLQKKATSPPGTLTRKPKAKEEEKEKEEEKVPTKAPPTPEVKSDHPKPTPAPAQQPKSSDSSGLANLANVIAQRAQERQQSVEPGTTTKKVETKPGTVIYRSGPAGNKASTAAPTTRPKPNVQKTTDRSDKSVEIKGATVDYSSTETPGASRNSSFLDQGAKKEPVNGQQVPNGDGSRLSVTAKAKMFESAGPKTPKSQSPQGGQNTRSSFNADDVPPPMIPPPLDFDMGSPSYGGSQQSWRSGSDAPRGSGGVSSKLAQRGTPSVHSSVHSSDSGVAHMVLIPEDNVTSTDIDVAIVPPPPVFDSAFAASGSVAPEDTLSMASTASTLSTLSSAADHDYTAQNTMLHSTGYGIAPPPPPSETSSSSRIEIAPPPPGFDDSPSDFIPPPMGFDSTGGSSSSIGLRPVSTGQQGSHSMVFPAVSKGAKPFQNKPIETWSIKDVGEFLESIQLGEHCGMFSRNRVTGQRLMQVGRSDLISLGITQVGQRMIIERSIKKAMMKRQ